jgi:signal transduction histidine kinase
VELEQVLTHLADGARQTLQADAAAIRLLDERGTHLTMVAASGLPAGFRQQEPIAVEQSPLDREVLSGRPIIVADAHTDPRAANVPGDYRSVLCVPLMQEGNPIGTLHVYAIVPRRFGKGDVAALMPLVDLGAAAAAATRTLAALEALEASKAHFIRVATHELRSPITVAQSLARTVLKGYAGELTDQQSEIFNRISRRLDFLESLVNDLLDLAAGKAPELTETCRAVAINASVGRVVLLLQPRAEEKDVTLTHRVCCEELVVWGSEEGLDRIFVNLVGNAVKYTPTGGSVTVSLQRVRATDGPGEEVQVQVVDSGIGIPEKALPHLFEEFYRAPNAKALDEVGTGLGLAIVKDLVDRFRGRIGVQSTLGQGATFIVTFPLMQPAGCVLE